MKRSQRLALVLSIAVIVGAAVPLVAGAAAAKVHRTKFPLFVSASLPNINCLRQNSHVLPAVQATVTRGKLNDTLVLKLKHFKKNLNFDLFTVQNSPQTATGTPTPGFTNFGLAWYQSDMHVGRDGTGTVKIKTILLDQIFGFDAATGLSPTNTFHVGFWFDSVAEAAGCGFVGAPTQFNGDHTAGPLAFVTRPNATSGLGPLCTDPSTTPGACNP